jgi:hypothetical protein
MKKRLITLGLLAAAAICPAPAQDKQQPPAKPKGSRAEQYAAELGKLLAEYQKQLGNKIDAEQKAYEAAAKLYDDAFRDR